MVTYPYGYTALALKGSGAAKTPSGIGLSLNGSQAFSIDAWIRADEVLTRKTIIGQKDVFELGLDGENFYLWINGNMSISSSPSAGRISPGEWVHLCAVCQNRRVSLYVNGQHNVMGSLSCEAAAGTADLVIGESLGGGLRYVRIYKKALEPDEVQEYMLETDLEKAAFKDSLAAFYSFMQNPPRELIASKSLTLSGGAAIKCYGQGARFRGNAHLTLSGEPNINPAGRGNDSYTILAWIYLDGSGTDRRVIFANGDVMDTAGMTLSVEKSGSSYKLKSLRSAESGPDTELFSEVALKTNQWVSVATTYNVDTLTVYVDGLKAGEKNGLLPLSSELRRSLPRIGAEVCESNVHGEDWFSGTISHLAIWDKALTQTEIAAAMIAPPAADAAGLLASYPFFSGSLSNEVSGLPLNERNNLVIEEEIYTDAGANDLAAPPAGDSLAEPLSTELLSKLRQEAIRDTGGLRAQALRQTFASLDADGRVDRKHFTDLCGLQGVSLQKDAVADESAAPFFTVTTHKADGLTYFIAHDRRESYTIGASEANAGDMTIWWIQLFLIIFGGVVSIVCGLRVKSHKAVEKLFEQLMRNPRVTTIFSKGAAITWESLKSLIQVTYGAGIFTDVIRALLKDFSWWKILLAVGKLVVLAITSAVGGWFYIAASLAILAAEVIVHLTKCPAWLGDVDLTAVTFNNTAIGAANPVSIPLCHASRAVAVPEWSASSKASSYAAYVRNNIASGSALTIKASFASSDKRDFTHTVRCRASGDGGLLGNSDEFTLEMSGGKVRGGPFVDVLFRNHTLNSAGVCKKDFKLIWEVKEGSNWKSVRESAHTVYLILDVPQRPWTANLATTQTSQVWVELLDHACAWCAGATTKEAVARAVTEKVNGQLGLSYDKDGGAPFYSNNSEMLLTNFLKHLTSGAGSAKVNCLDCATIVSTFANALGCRLSQKIVRDTGAAPQGFKCNDMIGIGSTQWGPPFNRKQGYDPYIFSYHAIAMEEPLAGNSYNNYRIYDACLKVNGSATPGSATGRTAYLPVAMPLSNYADGTYPAPNIPVNNSYREHLATNDASGVDKCRYDAASNGQTAFIYKAVR